MFSKIFSIRRKVPILAGNHAAQIPTFGDLTQNRGWHKTLTILILLKLEESIFTEILLTNHIGDLKFVTLTQVRNSGLMQRDS
jgi:hypothetical protein